MLFKPNKPLDLGCGSAGSFHPLEYLACEVLGKLSQVLQDGFFFASGTMLTGSAWVFSSWPFDSHSDVD